MSPSTSLLFKGLATNHATLKWTIVFGSESHISQLSYGSTKKKFQTLLEKKNTISCTSQK